MATALPAIGSFVYIRFGGKGTQIAHVAGHTSTGRAKVRAWNNTRHHWMPNTRTLDLADIVAPATRGSLPEPPAA